MKAFSTLSRRSQLARLRTLAHRALAAYGIQPARLTLLRHEHNTTWRVDAGTERYVLRINRPHTLTSAAIGSEMAWLIALGRDTQLGVPQPIAALDGSVHVQVDSPGVPEPRTCVVLRWLPGSFASEGLRPQQLAQVAALQAGLQQHTSGWQPPATFARPRVDTITAAAKLGTTFPSAEAAAAVAHPTREDAERAVRTVGELVSAADAALVAAAIELVRAAMRALGTQPNTFGLLHGDLHQENYLFHGGAARAIDFDDCGWGFYLYDLAVTLSELVDLDRYDDLRAALLEAYSRLRALPERYEAYLAAFAVLRKLQLLLWILESREHAAFRDEWRAWARYDLDQLRTMLDAQLSPV